jgi:hypothetical protein
MPTSSELFTARLAGFRSRAWLVLFANNLCAALTIASATLISAQLLAGVPRPAGWTWLMVTATASGVAAAVVSYLGRPTLRTTASAIDRALALEDRVIAGLQSANQDDVISCLVVREADKALQRALRQDVFPFRSRRYGVLAGVVFGGAVVLSLADMGRSTTLRLSPSAGGAGAGGGTTAAATATPQRDSNAPPTIASSGERRSPRLSNPGPAPQDDARPADIKPEAPSSGDDRRADAIGVPESQSSSTGATSVNAGESTGRQQQDSVPAGPVSEASAGPATASAGRSPSSRLRGAGTQGGSSDARQAGRGAGGVSGGDVTAASSGASARMASTASSRSFAVAARAAAEAALTRDDIPPELRRYVRDYFRALQGKAPSSRTGPQR